MNGPLLIVDDEPNIRRILQVAFEKAGIETVVAENGLQALRVLETGPVSGVLTDVTMPEMTGFELHDQIIARLYSRRLTTILTRFSE